MTVGEAEIGVVSGVDALVDVLRATHVGDGRHLAVHEQPPRRTSQGDEATVQSYVFIIERPAGAAEPRSWTEGARRFVDRLQRDGDGWRVVERRVETNMMPDEKVILAPRG